MEPLFDASQYEEWERELRAEFEASPDLFVDPDELVWDDFYSREA
jgi:hypothetical protein